MQPQRHQLEGEDSKLDLGRYFQVAWRRKWLVILPVLFITSITAFGVRFMSPLYVSQAKISFEKRTQVNRELERQIVDEDRRVRRKDQIAKIKGQLTSRDFLETVIRELGLHNDAAIQARAQVIHETRNPDVPAEEIAMRILVRGLRAKLKVRNPGSYTFKISIEDNDPENAYLLAKVVTRSFVDEAKRKQMENLSELFKFSSRQRSLYREKLAIAEAELRDFQADLIREHSQGSPITIDNINQAKSYRRRIELDVEQSDTTIQETKRTLGLTFNPLPSVRRFRRDGRIRSIEKRWRAVLEDVLLSELERMRRAGTVNYGNDTGIDGVIRANLRRRLTKIVDKSYPRANDRTQARIADYVYETIFLDISKRMNASLSLKIDAYIARAEARPEKELRLRDLEQRTASARANLETFQRTVQNTELSEAILATQLGGGIRIVDPAEKPTSPLRPNKKRLVGIALLLSILGGLGSIFAIEYLDKSFKDIDEIQRVLGLHVIGTIPRIVDGLPCAGTPGKRRQSWLLVSSFLLLFSVLGGMAFYEHLLRKQQVSVPRARAEAILQEEKESATEDQAPRLEHLNWFLPEDVEMDSTTTEEAVLETGETQ